MFNHKINEASDNSEALCLTDNIQQHLIKVAAMYHPQEMCGLITGRVKENLWIANNFHWIPNVSQEPGKWDYLMDPQASFDVIYSVIKNDYVKLVAIFHTHPYSVPDPSTIDKDNAKKSGENVPYLIYSPHAGFKAWMLTQDNREIRVITK